MVALLMTFTFTCPMPRPMYVGRALAGTFARLLALGRGEVYGLSG